MAFLDRLGKRDSSDPLDQRGNLDFQDVRAVQGSTGGRERKESLLVYLVLRVLQAVQEHSAVPEEPCFSSLLDPTANSP